MYRPRARQNFDKTCYLPVSCPTPHVGVVRWGMTYKIAGIAGPRRHAGGLARQNPLPNSLQESVGWLLGTMCWVFAVGFSMAKAR